MNKVIDELSLIGKKQNLFNGIDKYVVPLYQRAYSWTDKEIEQLIDDINDFTDDNYYLGSLIVYKTGTTYEVIDGQQRLTTLFILFKYLNLDNYNSLSFECRDKSNYTLTHLCQSDVEEAMLETGIINGYKAISQKIEGKIDKSNFIKKLSQIIIYRIEVPKHTDLNRYFEIMNTRGEQLEQHDILKALMMGCLKDAKERDSFAMIWDACADMTGYVQMHFPRNIRDDLFGGYWKDLKNDNVFSLIKKTVDKKKAKDNIKVKDVLKDSFSVDSVDGFDDKDDRIRFESIIEFTYFLLHVLKVFINKNSIEHVDKDKNIINELLDDKKLIDSFTNVIENGRINGEIINKRDFAINFINCLIKCRFLFDKYIIKREYPLNNLEGVWSIKSLNTSGQQSQKKPYYYSTDFHNKNERKTTYAPRNTSNIMIQSCLRVSYTSPKIMHWITNLLIRLYGVKDEGELVNFNEDGERIAKEAVKKDFFNPCEFSGNNEYKMGVNTPHIVLNYLDYLIWKNDKNKYKDFVFEFRNSVEHWYPQHPSDGTFPKWEDGVDTFGNLCIIQRSINSKFSNMAPEAKKSTYKEMIAKGSLKLRLMANATNSSKDWKDNDCAIHENEMLNLLRKDIDSI